MFDIPESSVLLPATLPVSDEMPPVTQPFFPFAPLLSTATAHSRYWSSASLLIDSVPLEQLAFLKPPQPLAADPLESPAEPVQSFAPLSLVDTLRPLGEFLQARSYELPEVAQSEPAAAESAIWPLAGWAMATSLQVTPSYVELDDPTLSSSLLARCTDLADASLEPVRDPDSFPRFRIWLKQQALGDVSDRAEAEAIVSRLQQSLGQTTLDPGRIHPDLTSATPTVRLGDETLLTVSPALSAAFGHAPERVALAWANNLRQALGAKPLGAGEVQMLLQGFEKSGEQLQGTASWYGPYFHGRLTATGETFDQNELTVAHKTLPFDTLLKVRNLHNDRTVIVRVNDRGPYIGKRSLDLSKAAAQCLGSEKAGVVPYEAHILEAPEPEGALAFAVRSKG
ncbi:MAG: septal ring lytic transglycosylase RlpA family protein [Leptolyngbya sp. SIO4C1]|nr:septal ring lytic transglycosylase RlpA family protein [Leptolyngbya sp. SIO4C1]